MCPHELEIFFHDSIFKTMSAHDHITGGIGTFPFQDGLRNESLP